MKPDATKQIITLTVNGDQHDVAVVPHQTLLEVLRNELGLTGTKRGCGLGACGVCTVMLDGDATLACLSLAVECEGRAITTIEGISNTDGSLHPLQQAFVDEGAVQCGFCTPGIIMTSKALLDRTPCPDEATIKDALAGTICRCTGHIKIIDAVKKASRHSKEE
ncbi:MAG: (2Fe-2S)-binding protein [Deltaproteobacteria bacterium]|nr:(2Fe-2S)-binding protein [Deltaproteobacteria bacterium]